MPRRDDLYLVDIVLAARRIAGWLQGVDQARWAQDDMLRDAVVYQLMIIGEAASSLTDDARASMPQVPWRDVRAFRNIAVHRYFAVDWDVVWDVAHRDAPETAALVERILREEHPHVAKRLDEAAGNES